MQTRKIGSLEVSVVGLGCNNFGWRLDADGSARVVDAAIDDGINFFDTADIYGGTKSEEFLGRALGARRNRRDHCHQVRHEDRTNWPVARSPDYVRAAVDDSLRRLGTDYIDLYQLHQPDPSVPHRRYARRARRARANGQGARDRLLQLLRRTDS